MDAKKEIREYLFNTSPGAKHARNIYRQLESQVDYLAAQEPFRFDPDEKESEQQPPTA